MRTASSVSNSYDFNDPLTVGLLVSAIVHVLCIWYLYNHNPASLPPPEQIIEVSLAPEMPAPPSPQHLPKQMVDQPVVRKELTEPPPDAFQSEKDSTVAKEQIHRGEQPDAGVPGEQQPAQKEQAPPKPPAPKPPAPKQAEPKAPEQHAPKEAAEKPPREVAGVEKKNLPRDEFAEKRSEPKASSHPKQLKTLALDDDTLLKKFSAQPERRASQEELTVDQPNYQAFSRPMGSGARVLGKSGSNDFLPNLPDGDITLLNTKANQYAVFVRRVAQQVFSALRSSGWDSLMASDIQSITRFSTVRAVLNPKGQLISISLETASGSSRFDQVLSIAVKSGARDQNPPLSAALKDGNIHFIFQARSWSRNASHPRTGAPFERRWLLLGTGLE